MILNLDIEYLQVLYETNAAMKISQERSNLKDNQGMKITDLTNHSSKSENWECFGLPSQPVPAYQSSQLIT